VRLRRELLPWLAFRFRRAPKDAKPTFFFHIPKCAGTSVWASLYDIYGTRHVYLANNRGRREEFASLPPAGRAAYSAVGGHAPLSYFRELLGDMGRYHKIVTLRDPVDRAISEYNYIRAQSAHPRHAEVSQQSLRQFAESGLRPDRQVTLLTGRGGAVQGAVETVTQFFDDWSFSDGVDGLVERLYRVTGVAPREAAHKNKGAAGPRRVDLDAETLSLLQARNRNDLALVEALRGLKAQ
jgi:sulfotransferase famil protein